MSEGSFFKGWDQSGFVKLSIPEFLSYLAHSQTHCINRYGAFAVILEHQIRLRRILPHPPASIWSNISIQSQSHTTPTSQAKFYTQTMFADTISTSLGTFCTELGWGRRVGHDPSERKSCFKTLDLGIFRGG